MIFSRAVVPVIEVDLHRLGSLKRELPSDLFPTLRDHFQRLVTTMQNVNLLRNTSRTCSSSLRALRPAGLEQSRHIATPAFSHKRTAASPKGTEDFKAAGEKGFLSITLKRSTIGLHQRKKDLVENDLGLKRRLRTVIYPINPSITGKVLKIKEMVDVEVLDKLPEGARKMTLEALGRWEVPRRMKDGGEPMKGYKKDGNARL
jgi:ribosomal protein L30/L7E